jgi:hypothetical protein
LRVLQQSEGGVITGGKTHMADEKSKKPRKAKPLAEKLRKAKPEKLAAVRNAAQSTLDAVAAEVTRRKEEAAAL